MFHSWLPRLAGCLLFQGIEPDSLAQMLDCLKPQISEYAKNELIARAGEPLGGVGIVLDGSVVVSKENLAGNRVMMSVLETGELFGEMAAFSRRSVWPASVGAQTDCTVMFLPAARIVGHCDRVCTWHLQLTYNMLQVIAEKALTLHRKVEYLALGSLREKIGHFLLEQYQATGNTTFTLPLNRNELADFLNITRPSLSRELGRMRDDGIVYFYRASIRIRDLQALIAMVGE